MRYLYRSIQDDLNKKMVMISGPRQVGKTTLAKELLKNSQGLYLNYDIKKDRRMILEESWDKSVNLIIFDEIHKKKSWKNFLKGIYDEYGEEQKVLVTGSARLDTFRKSGDALTGRYYHYRMHPIDLIESKNFNFKMLKGVGGNSSIDYLMRYGGFPESFFNPQDANRLAENRIQQLLQEDVRDLTRIENIKNLEILIEVLRERNGEILSIQNLVKDLGVSYPTVKNWLNLLEKLYIIFFVPSFNGGSSRSLKKEVKFYFYDPVLGQNDPSFKYENVVALTLLKYIHFNNDLHGKKFNLCFYRDREKREVDFVITDNKKAKFILELKMETEQFSPSLFYLKEKHPEAEAYQLLLKSGSKKSANYVLKDKDNMRLMLAEDWLLHVFQNKMQL